MSDELDSVKTAEPRRAYHHGALRVALLEAAEAVIAERGIDGFSLRETARRAGVSPSAAAHHFGDARGLLTALAAEAFRRFGDALEAADVGDSRLERVRSQGIAYVRFAIAEPAKFDLMWRYALLDRSDPEASRRAFAMLDRVVRGEEGVERGQHDPSVAPAIAAWAMVHGFARLALDGAFGTAPADAERVVRDLLPAVLEHLRI